MESPDDLAAALPAPREDEPPDLRRRIIAELRDHLHAALQRELLLTGDAKRAQLNVLARFGDPARLARKLWYDAMWEKIMTQRLTLAALAVVVLVCIGSTGLTWFLVVQAGQVNQVLLEQNRAANELLLAKLAALGNTGGGAGKSLEWNSLKVRLSLEKPAGTPAAGFKVMLQGHILDTASPTLLDRTTSPDGIADFGLVRPGQHLLYVVTPWGETIDSQGSLGLAGAAVTFAGGGGPIVTVLPGEPQTIEIVCPTQPEEAEITVAIDWPDALAGRPLWLVCDFVQSPREVGGLKWERPTDNGPRYVVVDPACRLTTFDIRAFGGERNRIRSSLFNSEDEKGFWQEEELRSYVGESRTYADSPGIYCFSGPVHTDPRPARAGVPPDPASDASPEDEFSPFVESRGPKLPHIWLPKLPAISKFKLPAGKYWVAHIIVGTDAQTGEKNLPDDMLHPVFLGAVTIGGDDLDGRTLSLLYPDEHRASVRRRNREAAKIEIPRFEAAAGRLNAWRLTLPKPLVELLSVPLSDPNSDDPFLNSSQPRRMRRPAPVNADEPEDFSPSEESRLPPRDLVPPGNSRPATESPVRIDDDDPAQPGPARKEKPGRR